MEWCILADLCSTAPDKAAVGLQVLKGQVSAKRQPSMTDRMLVGQRLNSREIRDEDVRR